MRDAVARLTPALVVALALLTPLVAPDRGEGKSRSCYSGSSRIYLIKITSCKTAQGVLGTIRRTGKPSKGWECLNQGGGHRSCRIDYPGRARFESAPRSAKFHQDFPTYEGSEDPGPSVDVPRAKPCRQGPYGIINRVNVGCSTAQGVLRAFFTYGAPGNEWTCRATSKSGGYCSQITNDRDFSYGLNQE